MALAQQPEIQLATAGDRIGSVNGVDLDMRILGKCSLEVGLVKILMLFTVARPDFVDLQNQEQCTYWK